MRTIRRHIIHASATPNHRDHGVVDIRRWHKEKGWRDIGYHFVIRRDGRIETGRPIEQAGAHVAGHNADSIGTCLIGAGVAFTDFTPAQLDALRGLHDGLASRFPNLTLHGHRELTKSKSCPGFNITELRAYWNPPVPPKALEAPRLTFWQRLFNKGKA